MHKTVLMTACLIAASGIASAATTFTIYNTGFLASSATEAGAGVADGNWTLLSDPSGSVSTPATPFVTTGSSGSTFPFPNWLADTATSQWISPRANETSTSDPNSTTVAYVYQETFTIPVTLNASTAILVGQWSADNYGSIVVNGTAVSVNGTGNDGIMADNAGNFGSFFAFTLNSSNATFHTGSNTIQFDVFNNNVGTPDVTGVNIQFSSATAQSAVPEPASLGLIGLGLASLCLRFRNNLRARKN